MPKKTYPHTLDDGYYYAFAGYVADVGKDIAGIRDAITAVLLDLELDPSSREDRKWAVNKFRRANPNFYDPDSKKKQDVRKNTMIITLFVPPSLLPILLVLKSRLTTDQIWCYSKL